ncbi:tRNA-splicing endonuclease subunit Sen2-1 [Symbiodinium microadriaticum]|uniref:tRNA-intron lyase n=1 Tax=Symbiodinium microadriaticum TaxID=2951 RepID=A0A1Q9CRQ4_SYMMI|nr:tRNA-splicing endonuclease subunit Sen2-1 [Symbiodinium microadriaticum]
MMPLPFRIRTRRGTTDVKVHTSDTLFRKCCELVTEFPSRYLAYRHYRLQGWTVCPDSLKFGADFLLYDGRPDEVHADYALILATESLQWKDVVMASRLAQLVAKELLLVAANASSKAEARLAEFLASSTPVLEFATRPWRRHLS